MPAAERNLEKFEKIVELLTENITRSDFVAAIEKITAAVADSRSDLEGKAQALADAVEEARESLTSEARQALDSAGAELASAVEQFSAAIDAKLAAVRDGLPGRDGRDGIDADEERVIAQVLARIKLPEYRAPIMDGPDEIRNKLELLAKEERPYAQEHIAIERRIEELEKRPARIAGGTSAMSVAYAFKHIAHTEEPTGAIDGVNMAYTVKNDIFWIAGFTLNGEQIAELPNFTYSGRTITFSSPIPAAYSGKDFEVKYIGI